MPELPDVEVFKRYLDSTALHQKIAAVKVKRNNVLEGVTEKELNQEIKNNSFKEGQRHGKYLFVITNRDKILMVHFGMTGYFKYYKSSGEIPEHTRVLFQFENGYNLSYINQRLLGRISLIPSIADFLKEKELGPDAMEISLSAFEKVVGERSAYIKAVLMDQEKIAGIGNVYADEICFQAGLHPQTTAENLNNEKIEELYKVMRRVLQVATEKGADPEQFPENWILLHREEGKKCPVCDGEVKKIKVYGRTSYFCPTCQNKH